MQKAHVPMPPSNIFMSIITGLPSVVETLTLTSIASGLTIRSSPLVKSSVSRWLGTTSYRANQLCVQSTKRHCNLHHWCRNSKAFKPFQRHVATLAVENQFWPQKPPADTASDSPTLKSSLPTHLPRPTPKVPLHFTKSPTFQSSVFSVDRHILMRMLLMLGSCGFFGGCAYFIWMTKLEPQSENGMQSGLRRTISSTLWCAVCIPLPFLNDLIQFFLLVCESLRFVCRASSSEW